MEDKVDFLLSRSPAAINSGVLTLLWGEPSCLLPAREKSVALSEKAADTQEPQVRKLVKRSVTRRAFLHAHTRVRTHTHTHTHENTHEIGSAMVPHQWSTHRGHEARIPIYIYVSQLEVEIPAETRGRKRKRKRKSLKHYNIALIYIVRFI